MVAIFCERPHSGEDARYTQKAANLVPNVDMMIDSLFKTEYLQKFNTVCQKELTIQQDVSALSRSAG